MITPGSLICGSVKTRYSARCGVFTAAASMSTSRCLAFSRTVSQLLLAHDLKPNAEPEFEEFHVVGRDAVVSTIAVEELEGGEVRVRCDADDRMVRQPPRVPFGQVDLCSCRNACRRTHRRR